MKTILQRAVLPVVLAAALGACASVDVETEVGCDLGAETKRVGSRCDVLPAPLATQTPVHIYVSSRTCECSLVNCDCDDEVWSLDVTCSPGTCRAGSLGTPFNSSYTGPTSIPFTLPAGETVLEAKVRGAEGSTNQLRATLKAATADALELHCVDASGAAVECAALPGAGAASLTVEVKAKAGEEELYVVPTFKVDGVLNCAGRTGPGFWRCGVMLLRGTHVLEASAGDLKVTKELKVE